MQITKTDTPDVLILELALCWMLLAKLTNDGSLAVKVLIFASSLVSTFVIMRRTEISTWGKVLILIFPWFLVNYVMTLRLGLALAIFLYAHFHLSNKLRLGFYMITPLIHYSFFIVIGLFLFASLLKKLKITNILRFAVMIIVTLILLLILFGSLQGWIGVPGSDLKQLFAVYNKEVSLNIGLGIIFWFIIGILLISSGRTFFWNNLPSIISVCMYVLGSIFFPPISRIMQVMSPFHYCPVKNLENYVSR